MTGLGIITLVAVGMGLIAVLVELQQVRRALRRFAIVGGIMAGELDALAAEVERNTAVDESAKLLLTRLAAKIQELINAGDPAKLQAFVTSLKGSTDALVEAVVANTPAEDPAP